MNSQDYDDEEYVDVRSLPLKPPQPLVPPERPVRRPWHPVMWDSSIIGIPPPDHRETDEVIFLFSVYGINITLFFYG